MEETCHRILQLWLHKARMKLLCYPPGMFGYCEGKCTLSWVFLYLEVNRTDHSALQQLFRWADGTMARKIKVI